MVGSAPLGGNPPPLCVISTANGQADGGARLRPTVTGSGRGDGPVLMEEAELATDRPHVVLATRRGGVTSEMGGLPLARRGRAGSADCDDLPLGALERVGDHGEGIDLPIVDAPETNHQPCAWIATLGAETPDATELACEMVRALMADLTVGRVVGRLGASDQPVPQPLVGEVGAKAVVQRRGDDPGESSVSQRCKGGGISAVGVDDGSLRLRALTAAVPLCSNAHDRPNVDPRREEAHHLPPADGIAGLRREGPRRLVAQVGVGSLVERAV
jgi:hypothetical protein